MNNESSEFHKFKLQEIEAGERTASSSLEWYRSAHGIRSTIEVATAVRHLALSPTHRVLDVGSGVGRVALEIAPRAASVVAVDISPGNVSQLLRHAAESGLANITAFAADLNELDFENAFDRASAVEVLQHIPSDALRQDAVARIYRALKPGGIFVTINNKWQPGARYAKEGTYTDGRYRCYFSEDDMQTLLRSAGFSTVMLGGCVNLPFRLGFAGLAAPKLTTWLDVWFSSRRHSAKTGQFLLAVATK